MRYFGLCFFAFFFQRLIFSDIGQELALKCDCLVYNLNLTRQVNLKCGAFWGGWSAQTDTGLTTLPASTLQAPEIRPSKNSKRSYFVNGHAYIWYLQTINGFVILTTLSYDQARAATLVGRKNYHLLAPLSPPCSCMSFFIYLCVYK